MKLIKSQLLYFCNTDNQTITCFPINNLVSHKGWTHDKYMFLFNSVTWLFSIKKNSENSIVKTLLMVTCTRDDWLIFCWLTSTRVSIFNATSCYRAISYSSNSFNFLISLLKFKKKYYFFQNEWAKCPIWLQ